MNLMPMTRHNTTRGSTVQNSQCQLSALRITPDTVGPSAGATEITTPISPIVAPRRSGGTVVMVTVMSSGMITAVPIACTRRATSRMGNVHAIPAAAVPMANKANAATNIVRVEKRCNRYPVMGNTTAITSRKPVVSHCTIVASTPKSWEIMGSATDRTVSLRIITIVEMTRIHNTRLFWRAVLVGRE